MDHKSLNSTYWRFLWKDHATLDDDDMIIDDDCGVFTYIWYDVNDFVLLLGDMTYAKLIHERLW